MIERQKRIEGASEQLNDAVVEMRKNLNRGNAYEFERWAFQAHRLVRSLMNDGIEWADEVERTGRISRTKGCAE